MSFTYLGMDSMAYHWRMKNGLLEFMAVAIQCSSFFETLQFLADNNKELPAPFNSMGEIPAGADIKELFAQGMKRLPKQQPDKGIAVWPELADNWLKKILEYEY